MLMQTVLKVKTCKVCGKEFTPARPLQAVCSPRCAAKLGKLKKAQDKRETRAKKEAIKSLPELIKEAQAAFNQFIRLRDNGKGCFVCGKPLAIGGVGGGFDAGHFLSRGAAPQHRYKETNCFGECKACNRPWGATPNALRLGAIARVGLAAVEALESDNAPHKWTKDEVRGIRDEYRARVNRMKKDKTNA